MAGNSDRVLQLARIFDAPRSLVFEAWIEPDHPRRWWGPRGSVTLAGLLEPRPGGRWRIWSRQPGGGQVVEQGVFHEVIQPERLLFGHAWTDAAGRPGPETLVTVRFAALGTATKLTLRQEVFDTRENRDGRAQRWGESLDRLGKYLTTIRNRCPSEMPRPVTEEDKNAMIYRAEGQLAARRRKSCRSGFQRSLKWRKRSPSWHPIARVP